MGNVALKENKFVGEFKNLLSSDAIRKQFTAVLKDNAKGFMVSLSNFYIDNCTEDKGFEPNSVVQAALTAAALNLPIEKNLGFAYLIPYEFKKQGLNKVNFQMGYKGYIQLAQRTGQYKRITATPIYKENFISWNPITEDLQTDFEQEPDYEQEPIGYVFYFRLITGFEKTIYKTKNQIEAHAIRYSSSYKAFKQKKAYSSIWNDNFEAMALKTVIKEGISKWGIMSVELQKALVGDIEKEVTPETPETPQATKPIDITPEPEIKNKETENVPDWMQNIGTK